jgi:hypothetical protein
MHELKNLGELTPGWGDEITFSPARPKVTLELVEPIATLAEQAIMGAAVPEGEPTAA